MRFIFITFLLLASVAEANDCPRIVSQSPYITHQIEWLGLKNCIVGASRYERNLKVIDTGGVIDPDIEAIAAAKPDIVITSTWTSPEKLAAATPPGARSLRLASFQSMSQIEDNLREIGLAAGIKTANDRADDFGKAWREMASTVDGGGRRVLLLSSCTGQPYSFGQNTWLADLFAMAGFVVADQTEGVRHLSLEKTQEDVTSLVAAMKPDVIFVFTRQIAGVCGAVPLPPGTPLVALNGELFLHPAPILIDGLRQLKDKRHEWIGR